MKHLFTTAIVLIAMSMSLTHPMRAMSSAASQDNYQYSDQDYEYVVDYDSVASDVWADDIYSDSISEIIWEADGYYAIGEYDKAIEIYRELAENEDNAEAYFGWMISLYQKGDYNGAIDLYNKKGEEMSAFDTQTFDCYCASQCALGNYDKAYEVVDMLLGSYETAKSAIDILTFNHNKFPKSYLERARGEIDSEIETMNKVEESEESESEYSLFPAYFPYYLSGILSQTIGDVDKAVETYEKGREAAVLDDPYSFSPQIPAYFDVSIVNAYTLSQDFDNIIKYARRGITTYPEGESSYLQLAYAYRDLGQFDKAIEVLSEYPDSL